MALVLVTVLLMAIGLVLPHLADVVHRKLLFQWSGGTESPEHVVLE